MKNYFVHYHSRRSEWCIFDSNMKLDTLSYQFLLFKKEEGLSSNTIRQYSYAIKALYEFLKARNLFLGDIDISDLSSFRTWYLTGGNREGRKYTLHSEKDAVLAETINNVLNSLSIFFSYLELENTSSDASHSSFVMKKSRQLSSRIKKLKVKKDVDELLRHIQSEEYSAIRSCLNRRDVLIADILYSTGMRMGELFSLTVDRFVAVTKTDVVIFDIFESPSEERNRQTKTGHRAVFIPLAIYNRIIKYITYGRGGASHKFIFVSTKNTRWGKRGEALSPDTFRLNFKRACRKNGLEYTPHDLRHTFATNIYRETGDLKFAQTLLGHKSVDTTIKYTHVDDEETAVKLSKVQRKIFPELLGGLQDA